MNPGPEPHFDADGNFIHRCRACGAGANFGYGVSLRSNKLGTWYCGDCRPDKPIINRDEQMRAGLVVTDAITSRTMPVELLRDGRGVYGIGVSDLFDLEGLAWSCGIEPEPYTFERPPGALILRPDRFPGTKPLGFTARRATEDRRRISTRALHALLDRGPAPAIYPSRGAQSCRTALATTTFESRCGVVVGGQEAAGPQPRRLSRPAPILAAGRQPSDRQGARGSGRRRRRQGGPALYVQAPREHLSRRRAQPSCSATDRHVPVLALVLYSDHGGSARHVISKLGRRSSDAARKNCATDLVDRGARLRDVAAAMDIPMALRHIRPGAAHLATEVLCRHPELLRAMPDTMPSSRIWLRVVPWAHNRVNAEFAEWAARHAPQIPGNLNRVGGILGDIADWVRAGMPPEETLRHGWAANLSSARSRRRCRSRRRRH